MWGRMWPRVGPEFDGRTLHRGKLTARHVETAAPGAHDDGRGLRLIVRKSGAKSWILRYQLNHRRRDMGLG